MNTRTLPGLAAQVAVPTDVIQYVRDGWRDLSGTDYPGALDLLKALTGSLVAQHAAPREIRTFHAWFIIALEAPTCEIASIAQNKMLDTLSNYDLKALVAI